MITIKKISDLMGYSPSTVSKALNNKHDINIETKKNIKAFAIKNNYIPNKNAISLRRSKSNIIAIILPRINNVVYSETVYNVQNLASKSGYRVVLFQSFEEIDKERECLDQINDGSIDGAIVFSKNKKVLTTNCNDTSKIPIEYIDIQEYDVVNPNYISKFENLLKLIK
jgi:LacI family transcriptional regulator